MPLTDQFYSMVMIQFPVLMVVGVIVWHMFKIMREDVVRQVNEIRATYAAAMEAQQKQHEVNIASLRELYTKQLVSFEKLIEVLHGNGCFKRSNGGI